MKKFISITLIFVLALSVLATFVACKPNTQSSVIRVCEVTHSVFYAPLYVALNNGYFKEVGLDVELTNAGGSDKVMTALMSNSADIGLLGPETAVYVQVGGSKNAPKVFGQLTQKDGSFIIGRQKDENFTLDKLAGKEIIGGRYGGMPAMSLEYAIKKQLGLWDTVNINYDIQFDLITAAFEGGTGDYCTMFEPNASEYERLGKGYIMASVGAEAGNMPYTAFMATNSYLNDNREICKAFMKAVIKGIDFVNANDGDIIATSLTASFPATDMDILAKAVNSYKAIEAYKTTPIMYEDDFNNLLELLRSAGTLEGDVDFNDVIDNSIAKELL